MSRVRELFTFPVDCANLNWKSVVHSQICRYSGKRCFKVRKSNENVSIGTCVVQYGKERKDIMICPHRFLERKQIFLDCMHLLTSHQPGNELHLVPEVTVPGGNIDYFLVSTDSNRKIRDFVGIELQAVDTTGSVWSERELALQELGLRKKAQLSEKSFGMNWKMTAKTILMQLHHKIDTFENINKHLVLVIQDQLLDYIWREFDCAHVKTPVALGDSMHIHAYKLKKENGGSKLALNQCYSMDGAGLSRLLGLKANPNIGFEKIARQLELKLSDATVFSVI